MANYREIVTKAVIGKGKKTFTSTHSIVPDQLPNTILGCWVINHNFQGRKENDTIVINGSYDVNIWYSCDGNSKTEVVRQTNQYEETVNFKTSSETENEEVIIRSLKQPTCSKAEVSGNAINYTVDMELGIELVGDTKVRIAADDEEDSWDEILDEEDTNIEQEIDESVNEDFIEE